MSISDDPVDNVLSRLRGVRKQGSGWMAKCPAHDDDKQSLKVDRGRDGCAVLICFAGCDTQRIVGAIDLGMTDLFPPKSEQLSQRKAPMPAPASAPAPSAKKELAVYKYKDEQGEVLYEAIRYDPKDFKQRVPLPNGDYEWKLNGTRRVLYKLPELITSSANLPVYIPEGEKDVLALLKRGLVATCNVGGAGKWHDEYSLFLKGRDVVVLPDNDESGRKHARQVAESVKPYARSVKVLSLPGIPEKGDVSDWLKAGGTVEKLDALVKACPLYDGREIVGLVPGFVPKIQAVSIGELLAEPEMETQWLVDDMFLMGGASLLAASPKVGKSTLARALAFDVVTGGRFLRRETVKAPVVYFALEEKREKVKEYFRAMGLKDKDPLHIIFEAPEKGAELQTVAYFAQHFGAKLVIIDPLIVFQPIKDVNDYAEVYAALKPLHKLGQDNGFHVLVLHHGKKPNTMLKFDPLSTDTSDVMGSQAFKGAVDTVMVMRKAPSNGLRTVFTEQRYGEDLPVTVITLDRATYYVHSEGPYDRWQLANAEHAICTYLDRQDHPITEREIRENAGVDSNVSAQALRRLVDDGPVIKSGSGVTHNPYLYCLRR